MKIQEHFLKGGLTEDQIKIMHQKALDLVENEGIQIPHEGILDLLSQYDGVKIDKDIVKFKPELVEKALAEAKYPLPEYAKGKDRWVISAGAHQTKIFDLNTKKIRETTLDDLIEMIKLGDALDTVGSVPVVPLDQPPHIQEIQMHKIAYENSRFRANDMFEHDPKPTTESAKYVYEMAQAANKWFSVGLYMISPRTFDRKELEIVYQFLDKGIPMWAGTLPIAGINAPITMLGAILQSMFETFGCLTMLNLINTKSEYNYIQVIDSFIAHPFDMKFSTFTYGSAEDIQCAMYKIALHKYYNIPISVKSLLTSGKEPDAQAAAEVAMFTLITSLAGARIYRCGGLLTSAEVYSGEQLVIVKEIIEYIKNLLAGKDFSAETLMADEIAAVGPGESFIGRPSTLKKYKDEYWEPELFIHSNLGQWRDMGSKSLWQMANEKAKKLIAEHDYHIADDVKKELDKILEKAKIDQQLIDSYKVD